MLAVYIGCRCNTFSATTAYAIEAHGHLLIHAWLCAETIALIRQRTKEVMNQPEMIAWLKATHKPQLHDLDVRVSSHALNLASNIG